MTGRSWSWACVALCAAGWSAVPAMAQEPVRTEPVVVTATRIEEKVSEQASSVSVVTQEEIELRHPAVAAEALQGIPGTVVQQSGSPGNLANIRIRGGDSNGTLVMIDGFPLNGPSNGQFDISSLPLVGFDRIEVVRGAQSALYGSNAMSGVVNFIPKKAGEGSRAGVGLAGGSFNTFDWKGHGQWGNRRGGITLGAGGFLSDGNLPNDHTDIVSFLGTGDYRVGEKNRVHAILLSTDESKEIPVTDRGFDPNARKKRRDLLAGVRWEIDVTKSFTLSMSAAGFHEFQHVSFPAAPTTTIVEDYTTKSRRGFLRAEGHYSAGPVSNTFFGVEYNKDRSTDDTFYFDSLFPVSPFNPFIDNPSASTINRSVYLQEELRFGKGTGASLGGRIDGNSEAGTRISPKAAFFKELGTSGVKLRAAYGRGFRVPTIFEKHGKFGNPDLVPEWADSYEAGIDYRTRGGEAIFSGTYFYQNKHNQISYQGTNRTLNVDAISRGVEGVATWWLHSSVATIISYTYTNSFDKHNDREIIGVPSQRGMLSFLVAPVSGFEGQLSWRVESDQLDFAPTDFSPGKRPGFGVVDIHARHTISKPAPEWKEVALFGKVQNLLNRQYEERKGYPSPGINFLLGAELSI
ncbi:MAG: TonB-dependent receptor [Deltaproteobacteria bacterium]|nr:TonB-dependent receptor [Deltaproteobacteria bacterium]